MSARLLIGDVRQVLSALPDGSVDLLLTSPPRDPFLALRSYLPVDHPDKAMEIGAEATPGEYIDTLLDVVELARGKLAPHGSICIELGDTYAGSGGAGGDYNNGGLRDGQERFVGTAVKSHNTRFNQPDGPPRTGRRYKVDDDAPSGDGWPLDKSLCLIPELFRMALVYGFNPLTGRTTRRWRVRNVIRWCRPNPPVGALADKVRPATSDMIVACVSRKRYFDLDAIRTENERADERYVGRRRSHQGDMNRPDEGISPQNPAGSPPLDHWWEDEVFPQDAWLISTHPYRGSHYAVWPEALLIKPILAMCPQRVCTTCGAASERITEPMESYTAKRGGSGDFSRHGRGDADLGEGRAAKSNESGLTAAYRTVGWSDCGHDTWRRGLVLDPFVGTGTTLAVACGHGRDAIGIDLDPRNAALVRERLGMFLDDTQGESFEQLPLRADSGRRD